MLAAGWAGLYTFPHIRSLTRPSDRQSDWITTSHFPLKQRTNEMSLLHAVMLHGQNTGGAEAFAFVYIKSLLFCRCSSFGSNVAFSSKMTSVLVFLILFLILPAHMFPGAL